MKNNIFFIPFLLLAKVLILTSISCEKSNNSDDSIVPPATLPVLTTKEVTEITYKTAICGGNITNDGGAAIITQGICWSIDPNPTINDNKIEDSSGSNSYTNSIENLKANTQYYIKAYATNSVGTAYGNEISFTTLIQEIIKGSFTDSRDGTVYQTLTIGDQVWMADNLCYLPNVVGPLIESNSEPLHYVYGYDGTDINEAKATDNFKTYGVLYNWNAAIDACPEGWHIPTDAEWSELENYLANNGYKYDGTIGGGTGKIAKCLANTSGWVESLNEGSVGNTDYPEYRNKTGFSALPGGSRHVNGIFVAIGHVGNWWSTTEETSNDAISRLMRSSFWDVEKAPHYKKFGFSVRCVKDKALN